MNSDEKYLMTQVSKVSYIYGILEASNKLNEESKNIDLDTLCELWIEITEKWVNKVDTFGYEEIGYIQPYAERIILEVLGKK